MPNPFDCANPLVKDARRILLDRLRTDSDFDQIGTDPTYYAPYVEYTGPAHPHVLPTYILRAFWQLVIEGIVAPGQNPSHPNFPYFCITEYGEQVFATDIPNPSDPDGYLGRLSERIADPDATVLAYLAESLTGLRRGIYISSTVMLGVAAERVFLLLCDSLAGALAEENERNKFKRILRGYAMKPKLDWVYAKLALVQAQRPAGFPDNTSLMVNTIYDLIRNQRNELGHPRELPPSLDREEVFVNLQIFPRFYETAEKVRAFLADNKV